MSKEELLKLLVTPSSERQFILYEALRKGATVDELYALTKIKHYFLEQMKELVEEEESPQAVRRQRFRPTSCSSRPSWTASRINI